MKQILQKAGVLKNLDHRKPASEGENRSKALDIETAEKIVNQYGELLKQVNCINGVKFFSLINRLDRDEELRKQVSEQLTKKKGAYYDLLSFRMNKSLLPHSKEEIRSAIELLLDYEEDVENRDLLNMGLQYLEYFC